MNICLISLDYRPHRSSGLTIYAEDLARGLIEIGHSVTVIAALRPGLPVHQNMERVELYRVPINRLDWISYSWHAARLLQHLEQKCSFQIVHFLDIHFAYAYRGTFVASLWQSFRQRLVSRNGWPYNGISDFLQREAYYRIALRYIEKPCLARAGRLVASCRSTRDEFITHYKIRPARIDLALQGIDTRLFRPVSSEDLRQNLGLEGRRVLLFTGFITPRKGLDYLGQAMQLLPQDVHLLIVGRWGPGCRDRFRKTLGPAAERVHEIGFISDEERPRYYSLADVYVSPSILEGLGITPIEAMACGTPAVVTSASSGPEEVGEAGIVVPPCDPEALALGIRRLLDDNNLRRELGQKGRERVIEQFSYQRMTELTVQMYNRFLQKLKS